ncbi:MAG: hypothetical protein PHD74_07795, partial [Candidatus Krumholzibacteria bacterium]|nr:hypothetical protein [Candidatus Krumholzibacteria bacterium]
MRFTRGFIAAVLLCSLGALGTGCGARKNGADDASACRRLESLAVKLSSEIEPLRGSRLGLTASDSLLFTYSDDEVKSALKRSKKLEAQFSGIPAERLGAREIDRATVIINWLRGVRFAFNDLESRRWSPLLYCWTAEEALWVLPSRITPPYDGELEAYRKRLLRIPFLFSAGEAQITDPAEWHVRRAIDELDTLAAGLPRLSALIAKRYGTSLDGELETVRFSILEFRRFASESLLPASRGRLILGSENLSKIFLYGELINADQNMLIAEGKKQMKRLELEKGSILRRFEVERQGLVPAHAGPVSLKDKPFESRIELLLEDMRSWGKKAPILGSSPGAPMALAYPSNPEYLSRSNRAPYLSIPPAGDVTAAPVTPQFSGSACRTRIALSAGVREMQDDAVRFALLCAAPRLLDADRSRCEAKDSTAAVFSSATFDEGWRYLAVQELVPDIKKNDPDLFVLILNDWIRNYARMIVVFSLHSGTMTSESAIGYLVESL